MRRSVAARAEPWPPGLLVELPWPPNRVDRVEPGQTRTLTVGAAGPEAAPLATAPDPKADDVLTGDQNLVTAQATLQYRVSDPVAFRFAAVDAERAPAVATASALTRVAGACSNSCPT